MEIGNIFTTDQFLSRYSQQNSDGQLIKLTRWDEVVVFGNDLSSIRCLYLANRLGAGQVALYACSRFEKTTHPVDRFSEINLSGFFMDYALPIGFVEDENGGVSGVRCVYLRPAGWKNDQPLTPMIHTPFVISASLVILSSTLAIHPVSSPLSVIAEP